MAPPAVHPWSQLTQRQIKTPEERALIAAIISLSTHHDPNNEYASFSHLTMEQCFDKLVKQYGQVHELREHLWPAQKKFRFKSEIVYATQWFKNGDHPNDEIVQFTSSEGKVVRYFCSPGMPGETVCALCGSTMNKHGWIDGARNQGVSHVVCPGDWVVTDKEGKYSPYRAETFARIFEAVND